MREPARCDAEALACAMAKAETEGRLRLNRDSVESSEEDRVLIAADNLKALLPAFARAALLLR